MPTKLRLNASTIKFNGWDITKTENRILLQEMPAATTAVVSYSCERLDISENLAFRAIEEYGTPEMEIDRSLDDLQRQGEFGSLASILELDSNEQTSGKD
ncbi:hypothetical protein ACLMJK_007573 [Lecanora helva]